MTEESTAMNNHYIPRLLLRQFAKGEKINTYSFGENCFRTKKLKNAFSGENLFDSDLEKTFATKIEGPVGDLLNHRLLERMTITLHRRENLILRKFLLIQILRSPIMNNSWEDVIAKTETENHPSVLMMEFMCHYFPQYKKLFEEGIPSDKTYLRDLRIAMQYDSVLDMADPQDDAVPLTLQIAATISMVNCIAFWDSKESEQEFILPKLQGIGMMDQVGNFYKYEVIRKRYEEMKEGKRKRELGPEMERMIFAGMTSPDNFSVFPISPTRIMVMFSPYFRAFFPFVNQFGKEVYPPLLDKEQFCRHFFEPMRMELFKPCRSVYNSSYCYEVKPLKREEVLALNALLLDMETDEFAFMNYERIRDSFWYYDKKAKFAFGKKHDFSHMV